MERASSKKLFKILSFITFINFLLMFRGDQSKLWYLSKPVFGA